MSENDFYNVVVSQFAKEDLSEIIAYYESLNKSYVESVITQIEDNILSLSHFFFVRAVSPDKITKKPILTGCVGRFSSKNAKKIARSFDCHNMTVERCIFVP